VYSEEEEEEEEEEEDGGSLDDDDDDENESMGEQQQQQQQQQLQLQLQQQQQQQLQQQQQQLFHYRADLERWKQRRLRSLRRGMLHRCASRAFVQWSRWTKEAVHHHALSATQAAQARLLFTR
jgi:molecular chaperone GrpE (heat shock protein)